MEKKRPNRLTLTFNTGEQNMLMMISERGACSPGEIIRELIRHRFKKDFPVYVNYERKSKKEREREIKKENKQTPEQVCENNFGTVEVINGIKVCRIKNKMGNMSATLPMERWEEFPSLRIKMRGE